MINNQKDQDIIKIDKNSILKEVYIGNTGRMFSIQSPLDHSVVKYYFKPAESKDRVIKPYRAYIQEAAYKVQKIINPTKAVKCNTCIINGVFGAVQEKIDIDLEATKQFQRYFYGYGKLNTKILSQILDEYLVDYCLCNYDAHASNFIIDSNGDLRGIDKEQSFRYIDKDTNDDLFFLKNYNEIYEERETIYTTIFKKIAAGEISYQILEQLKYSAFRLAHICDEEYREIFKNYAYTKTKNREEAEKLLDRIVNRKNLVIEKISKQKYYHQIKEQINLFQEELLENNNLNYKGGKNGK